MMQKEINVRTFERFRIIQALMVKEFYQIIRDPSTILISFFLPAILLFIYGFGMSLDINHLKIGLVLEDSSPLAQNLASSIMNSPYFNAKVVRDRRELTDDILAGKIRGIVVIPSYFTQYFMRNEQVAPIQVIADGSEVNTASFVQNYVAGAWLKWLQEEKIVHKLLLPSINVESRFWYNQELLSKNFLVPGSLGTIMTLIGTLLTALVVAREWERGTMEALMSTPITIYEILIGKLIPYFVLGLISMALCVIGALVIYQVPFRGSFIVLFFVSACFLLTALSLGLFISTLGKNQFVAAQTAVVVGFLPSYMLSGFIFEISSMPLPIRMLTYVVPARYFVTCLQTIFLVGDVWVVILTNIIPMLLIGFIFFMITARKTVKRLD